jgi:hypothetical protein
MATWEYHDADGGLVGIVARWTTPNGKTFLPFSLTDAGSWVCEGMPTPRPLFRLPSILATSGTVYVAEGEKAADALVSIGLCATTSPNGSKSAAKADWSPMQGRRVVIVPDRDEPGERYAEDVADLAHGAGAESVSVVRLSELWQGLPDGGDAADWIEHNDAAEPEALRAAIERLVAAAAPVQAVAEDVDPADEVLAWEPFPTEQLPAPLAAFVMEAARGIGCDESMVALPLLALLAGAIGNARVINPKGDHLEQSVLWTAVVSESGSGKTPAFKAAMQFADAEQKLLFDAYRAALAEHEGAMVEHDARLAAWKRELGGRRGQAGPAPDTPQRPVCRRLLVGDTTIEALLPILVENRRGVTNAIDELSGFISSFDAYKARGQGGGDRAKWLSMHDAGPVTNDRKNSGTQYVERAAVSITGGIQQGILSKIMTPDNVECGLIGRFVLAMPPRRPRQFVTEPVSWQTKEAVRGIFGALYALPTPDEPKVLDLTPDAAGIYRPFFDSNSEAMKAASGALLAMLHKREATAVRLALVIHVARQAAGELLPDRIDVDSLSRGIALGRWFAREGRRVYQALLGGRAVDQAADDAVAAERWIEGKGGYASVRDLRRGLRRFRDDADDNRAEAAARRLVSERRATWEALTTGGRPSDGIRLVTKGR